MVQKLVVTLVFQLGSPRDCPLCSPRVNHRCSHFNNQQASLHSSRLVAPLLIPRSSQAESQQDNHRVSLRRVRPLSRPASLRAFLVISRLWCRRSSLQASPRYSRRVNQRILPDNRRGNLQANPRDCHRDNQLPVLPGNPVGNPLVSRRFNLLQDQREFHQINPRVSRRFNRLQDQREFHQDNQRAIHRHSLLASLQVSHRFNPLGSPREFHQVYLRDSPLVSLLVSLLVSHYASPRLSRLKVGGGV